MHRFINNDNSLINIGDYNNKNLVKKCFQLWSKSIRRSKQQQQRPVPGWSSFSIYMICMSICLSLFVVEGDKVFNKNWVMLTLFCTEEAFTWKLYESATTSPS